MDRHIRIIQQNLMKSQSAKDELKEAIRTNPPDIILIQEPNIVNNNFTFYLSNQTYYHSSDSIDTATVILNNNLSTSLIEEFTNSFATSIRIQTESEDIILVNSYIRTGDLADPHIEFLNNLYLTHSHNPIIVCGDLNARHPFWFDPTTNSNGTKLKQIIDEQELTVHNTNHTTCRDASIIDLTISNSLAFCMVDDWHVCRYTEISDHDTISFDILLDTNTFIQTKSYSTWKFVEENVEWTQFTNNLNLERLESLDNKLLDTTTTTDIDFVVSEITDTILEAAYGTLRTRQGRPNHGRLYPSWWNAELKNQRCYFKYIKNLYHRRDPRVTEEQYKSVRNHYTRSIKKAKRENFRSFLEDAHTNNHFGSTFKLLKALASKPKYNIPIVDQAHSSHKQACMQSLISSLFPDDVPTHNATSTIIANHQLLNNNTTSTSFSVDEVDQIIIKLNKKKAPGSDHISNNMIIHSYPVISNLLLKLFNKCIQLNYFPKAWKSASLKVLPKPGKTDFTNHKSYRPISLLSNLAKIFEKLLAKKITNLLGGVISERQHGFMKGKSTTTALKCIVDTAITNKSHKKVALVAIDIASAFDKAWWAAIIRELDLANIPSDLVGTMKSYLSDRSVQFKYSDLCVSKDLSTGCPQGGALSPLLWNILLNDLLASYSIPNTEITAYADDLTVVVAEDSVSSLKAKVSHCLSHIDDWCASRKLNINLDKTKILYLFGKRRPSINFKNTNIRPSDSVKILGFEFKNHRHRNKIDVSPHINYIITKIQKTSNILFSLIGNTWGINCSKRINLYKGFIRPAILYASEIWSRFMTKQHLRKLSSLQHQILRRAIQGYRTVSINCTCALARVTKIEDEFSIISSTSQIPDFHTRKLTKKILSDLYTQRYIEESNNNTFQEFFPSSIPKHFRPDYYTTQFVTGHGCFSSFLHRIGKRDSPTCDCNSDPQTPKHILLECTLHKPHNITPNTNTLCHLIDTPDSFTLFREFCVNFINSHTRI